MALAKGWPKEGAEKIKAVLAEIWCHLGGYKI